MSKITKLNLALASISSIFILSGCNGGNSSSTQPTNVSPTNCTYGGSSKSYNATAMDTILTNCEFNRIYRGQTGDTYDPAYAEQPYNLAKANKTPSPYTYFSYANLVTAYNNLFTLYPDKKPFASGDYFKDMRELAAFLANINQETNGAAPPVFESTGTLKGAGSLGSGYGLTATSEGSCSDTGACTQYGSKASFCSTTGDIPPSGSIQLCNGSTAGYCVEARAFCAQPDTPDPAKAINQYFGRGSKQLTYAYNYIFYGSKINPSSPLDLANNPSNLGTDGVLGWETGLAYWSIPFEEASGSKKPSMHDGFFNPTTGSNSAVFNASTGFGKTVNIINGGVECGKNNTFVKTTTLSRINSYLELLFLLYSKMPIDKVEVTHTVGSISVVDKYSRSDLLNNILTGGVKIGGVTTNPASPTAPHLVKSYSQDGESKLTNYVPVTASYAYNVNWGVYGRYNSQPLIEEYYYASDTPTIQGLNDYNNGHTKITKIMLYYDTTSQYNTTGIASERLDCAGVENYEGN